MILFYPVPDLDPGRRRRRRSNGSKEDVIFTSLEDDDEGVFGDEFNGEMTHSERQ